MNPTENNTQEPNPFEYRTTPKNNWELLWWAFFDEDRVKNYVESLNLTFWQERLLFLKVFFFNLVPIALAIVLPLWVLGVALIAGFDLPTSFPTWVWKNEFVQLWHKQHIFADKFNYLLMYQIRRLIVCFAVSLSIFSFLFLLWRYGTNRVFILVFSFVFSLHVLNLLFKIGIKKPQSYVLSFFLYL
jgi:hypothetical protein